MKVARLLEDEETAQRREPTGADLLGPLVAGCVTKVPDGQASIGVVVIGELAAITGLEGAPLVLFDGQLGSAAVPARSTLPIDGAHVGKRVVLTFEGADPAKPIILGVLHDAENRPGAHTPREFEVYADGERLVVSAKKQILLSCGKASITLTESGKVIIQGEYVSSRAVGVNRIKGGSVQIN